MLPSTFAFTLALICVVSPVLYQRVSCATETESPTAHLPGGILRGKYLTSRDARTYEAYQGIHFGNIAARFENSVLDTSSWEGVKDATEYGTPCLQNFPGVEGSDDCLYLNIFTHKADNRKRPVLVYIHGGGFSVGLSNFYGAKYFMDEDIVLVTITYRVGVMGFLSTGDELVPGNMGLKDQITSLKWVQRNIAAFGGDPDRVTIFGESAGGASVNYLLLSPLAKGLFHGAVSNSGAATNPWTFAESTVHNTIKIGEKLGCDTANMADLVACLRETPAKQLTDLHPALAKWFMDPVAPFSPTLEIKSDRNPEPFLERTPIEILKSGEFNRVPVLLNVNRDEGILLHGSIVLRNEPKRKELNDDWDHVAPITFMYGDDPRFSAHSTEISKELRQFYFGNADITLENEKNLTNLYTDAWFLKGIHDTALHLAKHTPVYTGLFTHLRKDYSFSYFFGINEVLGVSHGDDLAMLFDAKDEYSKLNPYFVFKDVDEEDDVKASKAFVKIISSFAELGSPKVPFENAPTWPSVTKEEIESRQLNWFNIGLEPFLHINPFDSRMKFWDHIYNKEALKGKTKTEL